MRFLAPLLSFIRGRRLLFGGLVMLLAGMSTIFIPGTRDLWFKMWQALTRTPGAIGEVPAEGVGGPCFGCHEPMLQKLGQRAVHRPFAEERCEACHTRHDEKTFATRLQAEAGRLCSTCHEQDQGVYAKMSAQHVPYKQGWCTACHDSHASDNEFELKMDPSKICLTCHNMVLRYGSKPTQHPPFQQRACLGCHVPHASNNPKNTRLPLPYLCMNCHPVIARDMSAAILHPPFAQAWCTACHNPHAENHPRMVKAPADSTQPFVDLCLMCHAAEQARLQQIDLHVSHPVGGSKIDPLTGTQLTCVSCHHPHGSNNPRMWKRDKDKLCLGCHRKLPGRFNMPW